MNNIFLAIVILLPLRFSAAAAPPVGNFFIESDSTASHIACATVSVHSSPESVKVFVDSIAMGITPCESLCVEAGVHVLHFVHPGGNQWYSPAIVETLLLHPSDHIERTIRFPEFSLITSEPYGATVRWSDSVLGQTPLRVLLPASNNVITFSKDGFQEESIPVSADMHTVHAVLHLFHEEPGPPSSLYLSPQQSKSSTPLYLATGATVLTGATAAYFKIKADNSYAAYRQYGDQASLARVNRFDTYSGVSLFMSEVNLLLLTYLLLSR